MCYFHLEIQGLDGSANHGGGEPNQRGETSPGLVAGLDLLLTGIVARCQGGVWAGKAFVCNLQLSQAKPLDDP